MDGAGGGDGNGGSMAVRAGGTGRRADAFRRTHVTQFSGKLCVYAYRGGSVRKLLARHDTRGGEGERDATEMTK